MHLRLTPSGLGMSDVFISYAREDQDHASRLANALERSGWTTWWDRSILAGESFDSAIREALSGAKCVVVLWSEHSVASDWVLDEASHAKERGVLVPIRISNVDLPLGFGRLHTASLDSWTGDESKPAFRRVAKAVAAAITGDDVDAARKSLRRRLSSSLHIPALPGAFGRLKQFFRASRLRLALAGVAMAIVGGIFVGTRQIGRARVDLALHVTQFGFVSPRDQPLTERMQLRELGVSGLSSVHLPDAAGKPGRVYQTEVLLLRVGSTGGDLALDPLVMKPTTRAVMGSSDMDGGYRLSFFPPTPRVGISVSGLVRVVIPGKTNEDLVFTGDRVVLNAEAGVIDVEFVTVGEQNSFPTVVRATNLDLVRIDQYIEPGEANVVSEASTVQSGSIRYRDLDGPPLEIRPADQLRFAVSEGEIRDLNFGGEYIDLVFRGSVSGMRVGPTEEPSNLMPTRWQQLIGRAPRVR